MRQLLIMLLAILALTPAAGSAQTFEGTLRQRTITVSDAAFDRLLYGDEGEMEDPAAEAESEEAYFRQVAARLFAIPLDRVLAVAREEGSGIEEVTIHLKGGRIRSDFTDEEGNAAFLLVDLDAGTSTLVSPAGRYYVAWTKAEMDAQLRELGIQEDAGPAPSIRDLGRTLTVAGTSCRGIEIIVPEQGITWGWVSDAHAGLQALLSRLGREYSAVLGGDEGGPDVDDLLRERGYPLRVQRLSGAMGPASYEVEEVISVEQGAVADDVFTVPAGFTRKTMMELRQGR